MPITLGEAGGTERQTDGLCRHASGPESEFDMARPDSSPFLIAHVGSFRCALPVGVVVETLRPLPVEPVANVPGFVMGLAVVRGEAVPVVDLGMLLGNQAGDRARFVTIRTGSGRVALAVDAVTGLRELGGVDGGVPPLLREAQPQMIEALGSLDADLLMVLKAGSIVPAEVWKELPDAEGRA